MFYLVKLLSFIPLVTLLTCTSLVACAEVVAIHPSVPDTSMSEDRIRDILLGRITTWSNGSPIIIVLIEDADTDTALEKISGRDRTRLIRGWKRLVYAGTGAMPLLAHGVDDGLESVARHPGSIAVIANAVPDNRWKTIILEKK